MKLAGKVCIITRTGGGMGRAAALLFARKGALVVGSDLHADEAKETVRLVSGGGGMSIGIQKGL